MAAAKKNATPATTARTIYAWMTLQEAADFCGLSYKFVNEAAKRRDLTVYATSDGATAKILVDPVDLDDWRRRCLVHRPALA